MAAENFKVKKGLEVGTAITATSSGVNVTGIVTATQFVGDGSGLTGVVGSGSGVVIKDEGSSVGTAGTVNFVGSGVAAAITGGTATVTINAGGLDNVVEDLTPQLGGNLDLNGKFVNGTGGVNVTGVVTATTLKGNGDFVDIDVDGRADLDDVVVAGVSTFTGNIDANGDVDLGGSASNTITFNGDVDSAIIPASDNTHSLGAASARWSSLRVNQNTSNLLNVSGVSTFTGNIDANGNLDVDGQTDLDDLVVSGVGTFSTRIDTNGVSFGTNNNTFAAKFVDDAVANFGTHNDLKISHDDTHARITNTKGDIVVSGIISATSDIKVGSAITMDPTSGIVTATKFVGDGSGLTGVTASGSGIVVKHDGSTVGTAGTINFSTNLDVSAISAGIVTVTASGGSSQNLFSTIAVSGQSNVVADSTTDTLTFAAGSNVTLTTNAGTDTVTIAAANDNTQLSSEQVQDIVGAMFSGNTETDITATYQDADGTIDLVADLSSLNASNLSSGTIPNGRFPATLPTVSGANLTALNASEITSGTLPIARITDGAVTFAKMQNVGTGVFIGRDSSGTGDIETLTAAEARTLLNVADGATVGITTANTNVTATWSIGGGSGSGYQFTGPGQDGSEGNPDIYLVRGHKYRFVNTTGSSHPFAFRNEANNAAYTDGITGSQSGTQEFSVQHDAPAALKYRCTIHTSSMLGNIYIVGQHLANGANNRVLTATSAYGMNGESNLTFDGTKLNITTGGAGFRITRNSEYLELDGNFGNGSDQTLSASNNFRIQTGGVGNSYERVRITTGGDLLIADTTNSIYNDSSGGGMNLKANGQLVLKKEATSISDPLMWLNDTGQTTNEFIVFAQDGTEKFNIGIRNELNLVFRDAAEDIAYMAAGNGDPLIGIGTNNTQGAGLMVASQYSSGTRYVNIGGPSSGVLQLAHLSGNGCIALTSSTGDLSIRMDTIPNGNPFNHGSEKVRIKSNGRVGVGTDDPNTTLSVYGSVNVTKGLYGRHYSGSATIDTGIMVGELSNFSHAVLEVIVSGNPNHYGSGYYRASSTYMVHISTGWTGSALSTRIRSTRISYGDGGSSNNSEVTATFHLYDATTDTETNSGAARDNNDQLRIKVAGTTTTAGIQCFVKILSNPNYLQS